MSLQVAWTALVTAGLLDVAWAISMKYAEGNTRLGWSIVSLVLLAAFVVLLGRALQVLEVGVAYAVWTGIGAVGHGGHGRAAVWRSREPGEDPGRRAGHGRDRRVENGPLLNTS
jgi:multidrug transporter EmrE-like cation transporter